MRLTTLFCAILMASPIGAEEVTHFASGWPINLVNAACGDDEGCQTELANCPPGTDGTCTAQAGQCTESHDDAFLANTPCTARLGSGGEVILRLPDGETTIWRTPSNEVQSAIRAPKDDGTAICRQANGVRSCFTPIIDAASFDDWVKGKR